MEKCNVSHNYDTELAVEKYFCIMPVYLIVSKQCS